MMNKQDIISNNAKLGLKTEFFKGSYLMGYTEGNTIYLNELTDNLQFVNKHEVLHHFENTAIFKMVKEQIFEEMAEEEKKEVYEEYLLAYGGLYTKEEIENGVLDNEIAIDVIIGNGTFVW